MNRERQRYTIQPEDVLTEREHELLDRAQAGEITCPWCEQPLRGIFFLILRMGITTRECVSIAPAVGSMRCSKPPTAIVNPPSVFAARITSRC